MLVLHLVCGPGAEYLHMNWIWSGTQTHFICSTSARLQRSSVWSSGSGSALDCAEILSSELYTIENFNNVAPQTKNQHQVFISKEKHACCLQIVQLLLTKLHTQLWTNHPYHISPPLLTCCRIDTLASGINVFPLMSKRCSLRFSYIFPKLFKHFGFYHRISAGKVLLPQQKRNQKTEENVLRSIIWSTYTIYTWLLLLCSAFLTLPAKPESVIYVTAYVTFSDLRFFCEVMRPLVLGCFNGLRPSL